MACPQQGRPTVRQNGSTRLHGRLYAVTALCFLAAALAAWVSPLPGLLIQDLFGGLLPDPLTAPVDLLRLYPFGLFVALWAAVHASFRRRPMGDRCAAVLGLTALY